MTASDDPDDVALEDAADDVAPGSEEDPPWRMLHPLSLAVNLVPRTWAAVRQLWPLFLVALFGGTLRGEQAADLSIVIGLTVLALSGTFVHWLTLRYRVAKGCLEIRTGIISRNRRVIAPSKVQNVELVRNVFHRATGLVELRVETASGSDTEGLLSALSVDEAQRLLGLLSRRQVPAEPTAAPPPPLIENGTGDLLRFGMTSTRIGAALIGAGLLYEYGASIDPERFQRTTTRLGGTGVAVVFLALLVGGWGLGVVRSLVSHHGFRLSRVDDRLVTEEGLFTRRRMQLRLRKVQVVLVHEPWLRRLAGIASVQIDTAAARAGSGGTEHSVSTVPVVAPEHVDEVVRHALPAADVRLESAVLDPPAPRALRRSLIRSTIQGLVFGGLGVTLAWPVGGLALGLVVLLPLLAWLDWHYQGWLVTDEVVVSRRGFLDRTTTVVARDKIQSIDVDQGPLQRRYGLGEVQLRVAGKAVAMPLLDHAQALALASTLSASVGRRTHDGR